MSRLIDLRAPYHIKVTARSGQTLSRATMFLYVWTGNLNDRPSSPTYTLAKSVNPLQGFITFEISELARDLIDISFDNGVKRTEPVYIGYEITKVYINNDVDPESGLVFGLDGYLNYEEGIQASQNLLLGLSAAVTAGDDANQGGGQASLTPTNNIFGSANGEAQTYTITFPSTFADIVMSDITVPTFLTVSGIMASTTTGTIKTQTFTLTTNSANTAATPRSGTIAVEYGTGQAETVAVTASQQGTTDAQTPTVQIDANGDGNADTTLTVPVGTATTLQVLNPNDPAGGTLTYQWFLGGTALSDQISGATGTSYSVTATTAGIRDYFVRATSSASNLSGFSQRLRLTHQNIPLIVSIVTDVSGAENAVVAQGESITFTATAAGSLASSATFQWLFDGNPITGATSSTYMVTINDVDVTGRYQCRVMADGETATSNTISVSISGMPGSINRDINSSLSQPLTFGNAVGSFRDVTYTYTASVYEDILASDITDSPIAPASWITPSIQSHTVVGDNKVTVVRYTTNATYDSLTPRDGRKGVRVRLLSGGNIGIGSFTDFMRQQGAPGISTMNLSTTSIPVEGGTVTISVSGDTGATYMFEVNTTSGGVGPANWIGTDALSETTGTVGDTHTLTIPANDTLGPRTLNIIAVNTVVASNRVPGSVITQAEPASFVRSSPEELNQFAADIAQDNPANHQIVTVESNNGWVATLPESSNFRIAQPIIQQEGDVGPQQYNFVTEARANTGTPRSLRTTALGNADTLRIVALDNNTSQVQTAVLSIRFTSTADTTTVQDSVTMTQAAQTAVNEFRRGDNADVTGITVGIGQANAVNFQVRSTGQWTITQNNMNTGSGPANAIVSQTNGAGNVLSGLNVHFDSTPVSGSSYQLVLSGSGLPTDTLDLTPTSTNSAPSDLTFSGSQLNRLDGQDATITMNAVSALEVTYELFLAPSAGATSGGTSVGTATSSTGSAQVTIPSASLSVGDNPIYFTATNSVGTTTSAANNVTIGVPVFGLTLSRTSIDFPSLGGDQDVSVSGSPFIDFSAAVTAGTGYSILSPTGTTSTADSGFTVRAASNASATGQVTVTQNSGSGQGATATIALTRDDQTLSVFPRTFTLGSAGGTETINVDATRGGSATGWTAQVISGAAVLPGLDPGTFGESTFRADAGTTQVQFQMPGFFVNASRTSVIRITSGSATTDVTITQQGTAPSGGGGRDDEEPGFAEDI